MVDNFEIKIYQEIIAILKRPMMFLRNAYSTMDLYMYISGVIHGMTVFHPGETYVLDTSAIVEIYNNYPTEFAERLMTYARDIVQRAE